MNLRDLKPMQDPTGKDIFQDAFGVLEEIGAIKLSQKGTKCCDVKIDGVKATAYEGNKSPLPTQDALGKNCMWSAFVKVGGQHNTTFRNVWFKGVSFQQGQDTPSFNPRPKPQAFQPQGQTPKAPFGEAEETKLRSMCASYAKDIIVAGITNYTPDNLRDIADDFLAYIKGQAPAKKPESKPASFDQYVMDNPPEDTDIPF